MLASLVLAGTGAAGAFEVLVPVDASFVRGPSVAIVVRSDHPDLRVTLNGEATGLFVSDARHGSYAHGRLALRPGDNQITVSAGADSQDLRVQRRPYYGLVDKKDRDRLRLPFHIPERERDCEACHRLAVDDGTRKPAGRDESICSSCHEILTRSAFVHGPVGAFVCLACHEEDGDRPKYSVVKNESEHCNSCHQQMRKVAEQRFVHGPLAVGKCIVCHDPHGSQTRFQLHDSSSALCFGCHVELRHTIDVESTITHRVITDQGCTACHDPHASQHPPHLRRPAEELCVSCHDKDGRGAYTGRMHPVQGHPTGGVPDPLRPGQQISCTSCHQPHSSAARGLLRAAGYLQLCLLCHQK